MEKIRQAVTEIWVPQVWQPPAHPPARTVTTIPLQPEGLRGNNGEAGDLRRYNVHYDVTVMSWELELDNMWSVRSMQVEYGYIFKNTHNDTQCPTHGVEVWGGFYAFGI